MTRVTLIHTVGALAPVFGALTEELLPGVETVDVVDEDLLGEAIAAGRVEPSTAERLERHVANAIEGGSNLVLVTCSSMGPVVEDIRERHGWPLLRVDEAMADHAIDRGPRIGMVATLSTTLEPTADLIRRRGADRGMEIEVVTRLCDGAFAALKAGDLERHDEVVRDGLRAVLPAVDVVVLAQASMARVAATLGDEAGRSPILSSPRSGVERMADWLRAQR
jgi:Asp/Glu/hydantoin racemase